MKTLGYLCLFLLINVLVAWVLSTIGITPKFDSVLHGGVYNATQILLGVLLVACKNQSEKP